MRKSKFAADLKGPPPVREWHSMDPSKDGSPCVLKRRFHYWETNLKRLTGAERKLENYLKSSKVPQQIDVDALNARIDNRRDRFEFSVATLRNSIRFAMARINPDSEDYQILMNTCPKCKCDATKLGFDKPFVSVRLENGKTEVRCEWCAEQHPSVKITHGVKRRPRGRPNQKFHKELRYYGRMLDDYINAKQAVAGNSLSAASLELLLKKTAKSVGHFRNQSAREGEDADQQAVMGLMEAAEKFNPDAKVSKFAQFTTYASLWVRRRTQARKTSHCRPGMAIIKGKHVSTARIETSDSEEGRADRFHPGTSKPNPGLVMDVNDALSKLDPVHSEIVVQHLVHKITYRELETKYGMSINRLRSIIAVSKEALASTLKDHR